MAESRQTINRGISLGKVANYCGVTRKTILRWVQDGLIVSFTLPSGHHRVEPVEVIRFLNEHGMPVPPELKEKDTRKSVLVCEDDSQIRRVMCDLLQQQFDVDEAENGVEACIKLGATRPDLITLDIRMPKMDGLAVCRQIRNDPQLRHVRILIVSAHIDSSIESELQEMVDGILRKPFSPTELVARCVDVMNTSAHGK